MATAKIVEAAAASETISLCPLCMGHGLVDTMDNQLGPGEKKAPSHKSMPGCRVCKGRKYVFLNKTCACGGAAVWLDTKENVWYCGRDSCLFAVRNRKVGVHQTEWSGI